MVKKTKVIYQFRLKIEVYEEIESPKFSARQNFGEAQISADKFCAVFSAKTLSRRNFYLVLNVSKIFKS